MPNQASIINIWTTENEIIISKPNKPEQDSNLFLQHHYLRHKEYWTWTYITWKIYDILKSQESITSFKVQSMPIIDCEKKEAEDKYKIFFN